MNSDAVLLAFSKWIIIAVVILVVLFAGEPDLHDALISHIKK